MFADHLTPWLDAPRSLLTVLARPVSMVANFPVRSINNAQQFFSAKEVLSQRVVALEKDVRMLRVKEAKMAGLVAENDRLRRLLGSSDKLQDNVLVAELIGIDPDPERQRIVIDKGTRDGVFVGQPLIDSSGLMGQVTEVSRYSSWVLLISDSAHALPVQVFRNNLRLIVEGTGIDRRLAALHVTPSADLRIGDQLLSSGLGNRFPAGYFVGIVDRLHIEPGSPFAVVGVKPSAQLYRSRHVLLIFSDDETRRAPAVRGGAVDLESGANTDG